MRRAAGKLMMWGHGLHRGACEVSINTAALPDLGSVSSSRFRCRTSPGVASARLPTLAESPEASLEARPAARV